jgi:Transposase DDE domain
LILDIGCHFLAQVKRNRRKLWEAIALHTALCKPFCACEYYDDKHGHKIHRKVELYVNEAQLPKGWNGIQRLVKVSRWGVRNNVPFEERTFFVLSKPIDSAALIAKAVQGHWSIENNLHWTKDVNLGEDDATIKDKNAVAVLVYLNNVSLNMLRNAGFKPVKDTFAKFTNKVNELYKLFKNNLKT